MAVKPVQVSVDTELLRQVDQDPETRIRGRSAFVRSAIEFYLRAREQRKIEAQIAKAYSGKAQTVHQEVADLIDTQSWPPE